MFAMDAKILKIRVHMQVKADALIQIILLKKGEINGKEMWKM
jgi:hypothetical protein